MYGYDNSRFESITNLLVPNEDGRKSQVRKANRRCSWNGTYTHHQSVLIFIWAVSDLFEIFFSFSADNTLDFFPEDLNVSGIFSNHHRVQIKHIKHTSFRCNSDWIFDVILVRNTRGN